MAAEVRITISANEELQTVPVRIRQRIAEIVERLAKWPEVSGAKQLRGNLHGNYRIRTGDYRVVFTVSADGATVTIWKIGNRRGLYD
jgi:mRNA interferase RelE/StbE